jgi:dolichol-phosphate mannosyltransferase
MSESISVVVPVYGCDVCLYELHRRLTVVLNELVPDYEIILVDDGSPDSAWKTIAALCAEDSRVVGIDLSRNFGQHNAISAGLRMARGSLIVVMDCDLQNDPADIPAFFAKIQEGYDSVFGRREVRHDTWMKKTTSRLFYRVLGYLTDSRLDETVANFGMYRASVIQAVNAMGDRILFFPLMVQWVGFRATGMEVHHSGRAEGRSSYTWMRLFQLAGNVAITFSNKPLMLMVNAGFAVSGLAALYAISILVRALHGDVAIMGWSSVITSIWFFGGVQMIVVGVVGLYVGKIFDASKNRPLYIIRETLNTGDKLAGRGEP